MNKKINPLPAIFIPVILLIIASLVTKSTLLLIITFFYMGALTLLLFFGFSVRSIKEKKSIAQTSRGVVEVKGAEGRLYGIYYLIIAITITLIILSMIFNSPFIDKSANFFISIFKILGLIES